MKASGDCYHSAYAQNAGLACAGAPDDQRGLLERRRLEDVRELGLRSTPACTAVCIRQDPMVAMLLWASRGSSSEHNQASAD